MKGRLIVLDKLKGLNAAALMVDGQLSDFLIEPQSDAPLPGAIYRAVTDRPIKGQGGMILRLPHGDTALFRNAKGLSPNTALLVQVISHVEDGKAAPVTDKLIFKGRTVIITPGAKGLNISRQVRDEDERERLLEALHRSNAPQSGHGVIVRSNAAGTDPDTIAEEADSLIALADAVLNDAGSEPELLLDAPDVQDIAWRDWTVSPDDQIVEGFEENGVLDALEQVDSAQVTLGSGSMFIEPTRALIAVDVNTGGDFSPAAGLKANLACARALPRHLRLRGLGGQIVLDLAPMPKKDRKQFEQTLRAAFKADPIETALVGWTPLGHFELQRKRERLPLPKGLTL